MKNQIRRSSFALGLTAFGSYGIVTAMAPDFALLAAVFAVVIAIAAGCFHAHLGQFLVGVTLAWGGWTCLSLLFATPPERMEGLVIVPFVLMIALALEAAGFLVGRLVSKASKLLRAYRIAR